MSTPTNTERWQCAEMVKVPSPTADFASCTHEMSFVAEENMPQSQVQV